MLDRKSYRHRFLFTTFGIALTLSCLSLVASSQTVTGTLQGTVSDSKGAVVPGVDVVVRNYETGQERNLRTNSEGVYTAAFLPIGRPILLFRQSTAEVMVRRFRRL